MTTLRRLRSVFHVVLPVAVAAVLVFLGVVNMALVKAWKGEPEDGVLWRQSGANVVASYVDRRSPAARAGVQPGDVLVTIDGQEVATVEDALAGVHAATNTRLTYVLQRQSSELPVAVQLQPMPLVRAGLYYSVALVGMLAIVVGVSVRLRRPTDRATLHFFWLTVSFFGVLAFTPSGLYDRLDYFFDWADLTARLLLPPLFLHFAFVFPERSESWARQSLRRWALAACYLPAAVLGVARILLMTGRITTIDAAVGLEWIETLSLIYLGVCLLIGLGVMVRALTRFRSVTARRQLRWIVWGSSLGALPFVMLYLVPFLFGHVPPGAEYTAVLLGCIPLAFASAIVRYRLMDIEVIIKKVLVAAAAVVLLAFLYWGALQLISLLPGASQERNNSFLALLATLTVALVAPWVWRAIQAGLDRLYYKDRYDYRRALLSFTRDLNSDLDLSRLSQRLVDRIAETLGIDRIALFLPRPGSDAGGFAAFTIGGQHPEGVPSIAPGSSLATRLMDGQTIVVDDPLPVRRLVGDESAAWREAGLYSFVPCVSSDLTIAVIAVGRRAHGEPLSSEDMSLLAAVAGQAATAIENARLYSQLREKANEIESVRQFNANVVESLTDALVVVDHDDRVLLWNRRAETLARVDRDLAVGRPLADLFGRPFYNSIVAARRDAPGGTSLFRVQLAPADADRRELLVNVAIAPFERADAEQAGSILVIADITDRANLEEQLRLSEKMAAIGLLAAGVAHEVNTPLTGISSFTQMLLERSDPGDPRKELLEKIERQTFRAAKIVSNLLNLARPSGGEAGPVDLNTIIGDVLSLLEHQLKNSRVRVVRSLDETPVVVRGIEYKLQQVFLNLFLNARDAMPQGGALSVTTQAKGSDVVVEVSDTGVGIPAEHLARIYDPFFTTKGEGRGTGLGLSVTYGIVQEHGGMLLCESEPGEGTKFRLVLPAATDVDTVPEPAAQQR